MTTTTNGVLSLSQPRTRTKRTKRTKLATARQTANQLAKRTPKPSPSPAPQPSAAPQPQPQPANGAAALSRMLALVGRTVRATDAGLVEWARSVESAKAALEALPRGITLTARTPANALPDSYLPQSGESLNGGELVTRLDGPGWALRLGFNRQRAWTKPMIRKATV